MAWCLRVLGGFKLGGRAADERQVRLSGGAGRRWMHDTPPPRGEACLHRRRLRKRGGKEAVGIAGPVESNPKLRTLTPANPGLRRTMGMLDGV